MGDLSAMHAFHRSRGAQCLLHGMAVCMLGRVYVVQYLEVLVVHFDERQTSQTKQITWQKVDIEVTLL